MPSPRPFRSGLFRLGLAGSLLASWSMAATPVLAQGVSILRDTETEEMLRGYEQPLAQAAGLDPAATKVWLVGENEVNAFASFGDGGENILC